MASAAPPRPHPRVIRRADRGKADAQRFDDVLAEEAVIGDILAHPNDATDVAAGLDDLHPRHDFTDVLRGDAWGSIQRRARAEEPINLASVGDDLVQAGHGMARSELARFAEEDRLPASAAASRLRACRAWRQRRLAVEVVQNALDSSRDPSAFDAAAVRALRLIEPAPEVTPTTRFQLISGDAVLRVPPPAWLVEGILQRDSFAVLYGPPGAAKTFLALGLALDVASGFSWLGHAVQAGPIVYIAAEGASGLGLRSAAWCAYRDAPMPAKFHLCPSPLNLTSGDVDCHGLIDSIRAQLGDTQPVLIVGDTWARLTVGGDENSTRDNGLAIDRCDTIRRAFGCTMLFLHHTRLDGERERGNTALRGAADTMFAIEGEGGRFTLTNSKQKNGPEAAPILLELHHVDLDEDPRGSCVIVPAHADGFGPNDQERELLAILTDHFDGEAATTAWQKMWQATRGDRKDKAKSDSSFYRLQRALKAKGTIQKRGTKWRAT